MAQEPETTTKRAELPMRLTRLRVKNFRSIADIDIPLSPLTVLVGPNGSGKSNVVDALRFVRDVFARGLDQAVMDREGMGVIQRWGTEGCEIGVTFRIERFNQSNLVDLEYDKEGIPLENLAVSISYDFVIDKVEDEAPLVRKQTLSVSPLRDTLPELVITRNRDFIEGKLGNDALISGLEKFQFLPIILSYPTGDINLNDLLEMCKPVFKGHGSDWDSGFLPRSNEYHMWWYTFKQFINMFNECVSDANFYALNAAELRQPQRTLKEIPFDEQGRNLAAVLRRIKHYGEYNWKVLCDTLQQTVSGFNTLEVETVGGYLATKLIYHNGGANYRTSYLGQESDGTIRMLGILAALLQETSQPFISIEEPEANIHPGALAVLAGVIDEASLRSQILVTTHSPDMLDHLPVESFLVVEKIGDTTHVGPLDASQIASVRKRLFTPGELFRMEGLQRQAESAS
jgi:predicted ATPase